MNTNPKPREAMGTKGFVLYLISSFSVAVLGSIYLTNPNDHFYKTSLSFVNPSSLNQSWVGHVDALQSDSRTWPELKFSWRLLLVTVIGFLGSAFGTVGGVGGGGIFVPMINLILGFDTKSAAALSKCMIMGASISSVWYNLREPHPYKEAPILDYDLALLFQPMLMLGITMGVALSVIFPFWLITILIIILFMGTSSRSFVKGMEMWKQETIFNNEIENQQVGFCNSNGDVRVNADYEPLSLLEEKSGLEILRFNLCWKRIMVLLTVWVLFLLLQIIKNHTTLCGTMYWTLIILQFPVALAVFRYEAVKLYKESKKRRSDGNNESVCGATIQWNAPQIIFCAFCGILGGTVGGLLGSGGGFILGPLLLELGVIPQVASATATFVMMFSSSLSVVEFYFLRRFPIPYAWYLIAVSMVAGFWGQFFVRKLVKILRRASIIIFILSAVIFASALTMGIVGTEKSIYMIHKHDTWDSLAFVIAMANQTNVKGPNGEEYTQERKTCKEARRAVINT